MKSTPFSRSNSYVSGLAVIACSSGFNYSRYLYFKSPRLRVKLRLPSTRPSVIVDPDFVILSISVWLSGLWSMLISTALPFLPMTHRESPAFATNIFFLLLSIYTTFEVQPMESNIISSFVCSSSFLSRSSLRIFNNAGFFGGFSRLRSPSSFWPYGVLSSTSTFKKERRSHSFTSFSYYFRSLIRISS